MDFSAYVKKEGDYIRLVKQYAEIYIPMDFFSYDEGFAQDYGRKVRAMGLLHMAFFKNGNLEEWKTLNLPTWIELESSIYDERNVQLPGDEQTTWCKVLKYSENDIIMNKTVVEDSSNAQLFLKFITQGKLPQTISYEKSIHVWQKNQRMNSVHLGVPSIILELILSASYRDKKNLTNKFAWVYAKDPKKVSQYDYKMASIREICRYTSTFTAMTFEDIDSMVTSSVNRTRQNIPEPISPVETTIKY